MTKKARGEEVEVEIQETSKKMFVPRDDLQKNEPSKVRQTGGHGRPHLPQRGVGVAQHQREILLRADIYLLWPVLRGGEPLQAASHLH